MNTISITKLFTAVGFFVVTVFGTPGFTAEETKTGDSFEAKSRAASNLCKDPEVYKPYGGEKKCVQCLTLGGIGCNETQNDSACDDAYKTYQDNLTEAQSACKSVTGSSKGASRYTPGSKNNCTDKIEECASFASQASSATEQNDNGLSSTIDLFRSVIDGDSTLGPSGSNQCLENFDSKDARDAEKEFREQRQALEKEKQKIEDDMVKDKAENDKEITRISKEIQELQRNNKETLAKADVKMREQLNASQKDIVDASSRLRNLTKQISKKNDTARQLNFAYADRMLDASTQKQNLRCKTALDLAKSCMIKSVKGIKDESCKDFPFTIKSKGPKATAELKSQLKVVNDACYEKEERERKKTAFDQQEQLKTVNDEIAELQAQIKEEGQRQQIQSENSTKIQQEADREKQEAQANMADQIKTLNNEMDQFTNNLGLKTKISQDRLKELKDQLDALAVQEKTGMRSKTSLAMKAVSKSNSQMSNVIVQCDCNENLSNVKPEDAGGKSDDSQKICKQLKNNLVDNSETKKSSSSKPRTTQ